MTIWVRESYFKDFRKAVGNIAGLRSSFLLPEEHLREPAKGLVKELLKNDMEPIDAVNW